MSHRVWNVGKGPRVRGEGKKEEKEGQKREREESEREGESREKERKGQGWRDEKELEISFPAKMPLEIK